MEIIIDTKDGILSNDDYSRIVTDPTNAGTYNYYSPNDDSVGHKDYDVDPYIDFGNGAGDITSLDDRRNVLIKVPATSIHVPAGVGSGELPDGDTKRSDIYQNDPSIIQDINRIRINEALDSFEEQKNKKK